MLSHGDGPLSQLGQTCRSVVSAVGVSASGASMRACVRSGALACRRTGTLAWRRTGTEVLRAEAPECPPAGTRACDRA